MFVFFFRLKMPSKRSKSQERERKRKKRAKLSDKEKEIINERRRLHLQDASTEDKQEMREKGKERVRKFRIKTLSNFENWERNCVLSKELKRKYRSERNDEHVKKDKEKDREKKGYFERI